LAPVVVACGFGNLQDHQLAVNIRQIGIDAAGGEPGEHRTARTGRGVIDVKETGVFETGVEGHSQKSLFVVLLADPVSDVQENRGFGNVLAVGENTDKATLLGYKEPVGAIVGLGQVGQPAELKVWEDPLHCQRTQSRGRAICIVGFD